jgi:HEAT repeats
MLYDKPKTVPWPRVLGRLTRRTIVAPTPYGYFRLATQRPNRRWHRGDARMRGSQQTLSARRQGSAKPSTPRRLQLYAVCFASLAITSTFAGYEASQYDAAGAVQAATVSSVPAAETFSSPTLGDLGRLPAQQQAQQLLELAIRHEPQSFDLIAKNVDGWRGHLANTGTLSDLIRKGMNSDDLRVRAAALEVDLAANNLSKSPKTVTELVKRLHDDPANRSWILWRLGALGNRGVQPEVVLAQLLVYVHDPSEETRYWAVEGLAALGTDASVDPLLDRFAHDRSARVRRRAACNLAAAGMLSKEQRLAAVPELLNFFDDDAMDASTRGWVYGALRLITGAHIGNDANAWRQWWAKRDTTHTHAHHPTFLLFA